MARKQAPCGTNAAYQRHHKLGEPMDEACREAHNDYAAQYRGTTDWKTKERNRRRIREEARRLLVSRHRYEYLEIEAAVLRRQAAAAARKQRERDERLFALLNGGQTT